MSTALNPQFLNRNIPPRPRGTPGSMQDIIDLLPPEDWHAPAPEQQRASAMKAAEAVCLHAHALLRANPDVACLVRVFDDADKVAYLRGLRDCYVDVCHDLSAADDTLYIPDDRFRPNDCSGPDTTQLLAIFSRGTGQCYPHEPCDVRHISGPDKKSFDVFARQKWTTVRNVPGVAIEDFGWPFQRTQIVKGLDWLSEPASLDPLLARLLIHMRENIDPHEVRNLPWWADW